MPQNTFFIFPWFWIFLYIKVLCSSLQIRWYLHFHFIKTEENMRDSSYQLLSVTGRTAEQAFTLKRIVVLFSSNPLFLGLFSSSLVLFFFLFSWHLIIFHSPLYIVIVSFASSGEERKAEKEISSDFSKSLNFRFKYCSGSDLPSISLLYCNQIFAL